MTEVPIKEIAFGRTGDKGDISNVGIVPYRGEDYELLCEKLTAEFVGSVYEDVVEDRVERYEYPGIKALNFVMYQALDGGVSRSLALDTHGKSMHAVLLDVTLDLPEEYQPPAECDGQKVWTRE